MNQIGYRGWVSIECFGRELFDEDPSTARIYAGRAKASWEATWRELKWENYVNPCNS